MNNDNIQKKTREELTDADAKLLAEIIMEIQQRYIRYCIDKKPMLADAYSSANIELYATCTDGLDEESIDRLNNALQDAGIDFE